jgi:hypothetical protein
VVVGGCCGVFRRVPADLWCLNVSFIYLFLSLVASVVIPIIVAIETSACQRCLWRGCLLFALWRLKLVKQASFEFPADFCDDSGDVCMYPAKFGNFLSF